MKVNAIRTASGRPGWWVSNDGRSAAFDGTAIRMRAGDTVWTPAGEEHWHGGGPNSMTCHYAILDAAGDGDATTWLEPVTDVQYTAADANA